MCVASPEGGVFISKLRKLIYTAWYSFSSWQQKAQYMPMSFVLLPAYNLPVLPFPKFVSFSFHEQPLHTLHISIPIFASCLE